MSLTGKYMCIISAMDMVCLQVNWASKLQLI